MSGGDTPLQQEFLLVAGTSATTRPMTDGKPGIRAELREGRWQLSGAADADLINGYLG